MKTRLLQFGCLALCAAAVLLVGGCVEDSAAENAEAPPQATNIAPAGVTSGAASETVVEIPENATPPEHPEPAPGSTSKPVPAELKLSSKTAEIVKLSQAGVNDSVMLAFVTNSTGTFNLGSDQIVYLNDLGIPSEVLTAMIEHDRLIREGGAAAAPAAPAAAFAATVPPAETAATAAPSAEPPPAGPPESVPEPPANVTYNYFYNSLSPYGTWFEVDGYGRCWQPSVVVLNSGWRPYADGGRWIYSDYGWYWNSDYSWGWAPFHYGRWFCHSRWGWCWRPDYTWGPSWVSWRYTDAYCGWAPLPPAACYTAGVGFTYYGSSVGMSFGFGLGWSSYAFVPWGHFHDHHPHRHCVPHHEARPIYEHSTVVNNIAVGSHNTVINHGIGADRVRHYTRTEVRPVRVREVALSDRDHRTPGDRLERGGRELVIQRPRLPDTPATPVRPPRMSAPRSPATAAVNAPPSNRQPGSGRERSPSENSARHDRSELTARGAPPARPSAPLSPGTGTAVVNPLPNRTPPPVVRTPSGNTVAPVTPPGRDRGTDRQNSRPNSAVMTPPTPAPSVPSKLDSTPPKNEVFPPGSVVWNGRRESSPAASLNPPSISNPSPNRTQDERNRAHMTTVWPRPTDVPPRAVATPPSQSPVVRTPPAQVTPRVIEVSPPRTYSAPAPVVRSEPRYSAPSASPVVRSEPRYMAPSAPPVARAPNQPSYSPPSSTHSAPSAPPPSSGSSSGSSRSGRGSDSRNR